MKHALVTKQNCAFAKASLRKRFASIIALCALLLCSFSVSAQTETLSTGSYIINMGVVPQTQSNGLKPYGLVYDLLKNYHVPVKWVISQTKLKDGADFTYNGVQYKGGTFIIPAEFRNATVNARITAFGVTGTTTTSPLTVDVTYTLSSAPRWTLDVQNGSIAENFFDDAGVPASAYNSKTPAQLTGCDDIYVMPHADADWSYYGPILNWVKNNRGSFWGGCRTGSQMENLYNPANTTQQMNFLSTNVGTAGHALLPFDDHKNGTPPYTHQFPSSPAAQYMGVTDDAQQNGSEQIYMPVLNGAWRATTQLIAFDPTQQDVPSNSPGPAASVVFGRAFGNTAYGSVMYEGGHNISGTSEDRIAAQRAFWSFSLYASIDNVPVISALTISDVLVSANTYNVSVTASSPNGSALTYQWSSSCGGTFANATAASTTFTAPTVTSATTCTITVTVTDACGRATFHNKIITIIPRLDMYPDYNVTYVNVPVPGNVSTNDVVPAGTVYGTSPTLISSPVGSAPSITMNSNGTYSFVSNLVGVYVYKVPVCAPGQASPCPTTLLTITVLGPNVNNNPPVANTDIATTKMNTPVTLNTLINDKAGNPGGSLNPASVVVTVAPLHGTTSINPATGNNTYTPNAGFTGLDTLTYSVCDNSTPPLCATALQIINVRATNYVNTTMAADDYAYTPVNTAVSGNVKPNDTDPEGNAQTVTPQNTTVAGKGTLVLSSDGSYTFTPILNYTGPVNFPYTTCDNGVPQACAMATLYILVSPLASVPDLTPSIFNDGTTLIQNTSRDNVIRIFNIGAGATSAPIIFTIPKMLPAFEITINPNETMMDVFGGTTVANADWTIVEQASRYVLTSKPGIVIPAGGFKDIGVKVKAVGIKNSTGNLSVQIVFGTGGGETPFNNNTDNNTYSTN